MSNGQTQADRPELLMSDVHRLFASIYYRKLKSAGVDLTQAQWRVLSLLRVKNGRTQSELAEVMLMEKAPMGALLDKLEAKQLIERRQDPVDRRAKRIHTTDRAQPLFPILEQASEEIMEVTNRGVSDDDKQALTRILKEMRSNLEGLRREVQ